jgi:hypothetical protein
MQKDILRMALSDDTHLGGSVGRGGRYSDISVDRQSTKPALYSKLPKTSTIAQPPKEVDSTHLGTPIKPIPQPIPTGNTSGGMPYSDYDY